MATERPHWHIDYFRPYALPKYIWLTSKLNTEHHWATALATWPEVRHPVAGFGASDCHCFSHLIFLPRKPLLDEFILRFNEVTAVPVT